jgi:hypothetical protein
MKKTYSGSCHCGAVRYEVGLDLAAGTFRCNCSLCRKVRSWLAVAAPQAFRLLTPEDALADYQFGARANHHLFCRTCGVRPFGHGEAAEFGGRFYAINVMCLDAGEDELAAAPVAFVDGRHDRWDRAPSEPYL